MDHRAVFDAMPDGVFRIRFKDGEMYVLRMVRDASDAAGKPDTWNGFIIEREGLSERKLRFHTVGGGLEFQLGDIETVDVVGTD